MSNIKLLFFNIILAGFLLANHSAFAQYTVESCDEYSDGNCAYYPEDSYYYDDGPGVVFSFPVFFTNNHSHEHHNTVVNGGNVHGASVHQEFNHGGSMHQGFTHGGGVVGRGAHH